MTYTLYEINIFVNAQCTRCGLIHSWFNTFSINHLLLQVTQFAFQVNSSTSRIIKYHDMILKVVQNKCPTTNEDLKNKVNE